MTLFISISLSISTMPMEKPTNIIRTSVHTFLQNYQYFTTTVVFLVFPFSSSILLAQLFLTSSSSSSILPFIYNRLRTLFQAAGFPSSEFFTILTLKLSQTIFSSIFTLPFTLTFLLFAKASIIKALKQHRHKVSSSPPSFSSFLSIFNPLFLTHICNSFVILSANATVFAILFFAFNFLEGIGFSSSPDWLLFFSATGAVLYSVVLANALIISNLALVISGMERRTSGYLAILKACVLIRGRTSTALSLALPVNLLLAGVEALFQYRILRIYHHGRNFDLSMGSEGVLIAYLYSICVVLDTVVSCIFYKSCKASFLIEQEEGRYQYQIEIMEEETRDYVSVKNCEELP